MTAIAAANPARRVRHVARTLLSEHPALYLPFARRRYPGPSPEVIGADTELVLDGYTRSGSTLAVYVFQLAQPRPVRLAHHLHAPAQLIAAVRRGLPALLLVREPQEAVLSHVAREPRVDLRDALRGYVRFHERLLPYADGFVVADHREVVADPAAVVRRLNLAFGTDFGLPRRALVEQSRELVRLRPSRAGDLLAFESGLLSLAELRGLLSEHPERFQVEGEDDAWLPSTAREERKHALRASWAHERLAGPRAAAQTVYETYRARSAHRQNVEGES